MLVTIEYTKHFTSGNLCGLHYTGTITIDQRFLHEWANGSTGVDYTGNGYTLENVRIVE